VIAVVPVRAGALPLGAEEAIAEAGGDVLLVGEDTRSAADVIRTEATRVRLVEAGAFAPGAWAAALAPVVDAVDVVLLPASADGRDLAPRLAAAMGRPLWAGAVAVRPDEVVVARFGGLALARARLGGPAVATLQPGVAGVVPRPEGALLPAFEALTVEVPDRHEAEVLDVIEATAATIDLAEAPRIVAGGAGLGDGEQFSLLAALADRLDASVGATRVATDHGWAAPERQIGTTGVTVAPQLYVALGISGAVQHLAGIGDPEHVIAVNTDASCPMMAVADLAVVADARAVLRELAERLEVAYA
jgi:electron transfer flavoprotein alpha subunit